ncbi:MAG: 5'-deoxynucleotidase [Clostridia bacterium]|jgi:5'-deoxynucleotidase|nr:5'-deoxynucleotidase [Clostridia bacterium]
MEKFYAYMDRMKFIKRWQLMRSTREENIMEHSQSVAVLTHALAVIENSVYGGRIDAEKAVLYALYHEVSEVMTGDLPTPVKYYNQQIHGEYEKLETLAVEKIANTLPDEMKKELLPYLSAKKDSEEYKIVKAADKLSAYIKCLEELRSGNNEFIQAKHTIGKSLAEMKLSCVDYFFEHFISAFSLTLDELEGL